MVISNVFFLCECTARACAIGTNPDHQSIGCGSGSSFFSSCAERRSRVGVRYSLFSIDYLTSYFCMHSHCRGEPELCVCLPPVGKDALRRRHCVRQRQYPHHIAQIQYVFAHRGTHALPASRQSCRGVGIWRSQSLESVCLCILYGYTNAAYAESRFEISC